MSKIELTDNGMDIIRKMSEGNPGAMSALVSLLSNNERIDPQSAFGGLSTILQLDTSGIYGSHIWVLYSDVCSKNVRDMIMLARAVQLGFYSCDSFIALSDDMSGVTISSEELASLDYKVCEQLVEFAKE